MNINPGALRIMCFGDSNTYGAIPITGKRRPLNERWTGILQFGLGNKYEVVEEGLCARVTDFDDPKHKGKNALTYLTPCLESNYPIDIVILMLGSNDLKYRFNREPSDIASSIEKLVREIIDNAVESEEKQPKIILMCPPKIDESNPLNQGKDKFQDAEKKSMLLPNLYNEIASKYGLEFINLQRHIAPSKADGLHLDVESHKIIAKLVESKITSTF